MEAPLDHIAMEAVTTSGTTQKRSKKKKRKKHHKTARWEHLSETANRDDSKNGRYVVDKLMPGGSSSTSPATQMKSSDSAAIKKTQPDAVLQADKAHQAVSAEATSVEPVVPQADKADASDDLQQQYKDFKEAAVVVSKLKRPLPTTGGPFGGLWSTRSSSPEQPSGHLHRSAEASVIDVKQKPPSLSPKQTSFSTIAKGGEAHAELPDQLAAFSPTAQESEGNVNVLDHTGPFPAIAEVGTGRRVSIALPNWGGPFGLLSSSADRSSESLPDKLTAQTADAKHESPQESPLYMAPSLSAAVTKEEGTPLPGQATLSPTSVTKKVVRHVLEETAFTVNSVGSEEDACVQHKKASPTSTSSFESSEYKSSRGSLAHSPHAKPETDVRGPRRIRSMSLVLLEEAPLLQSQPVVTPTSPPPPKVVPSMPKLERPDLSQEAAISPTAVAESGKREKAAGKGKKKRLKKAKKKEVMSAVTSPSTNGPDPDKPAPKSSEDQSASASRVNSVNEMNKRIEVLRCQQVDFTASPGAHSPLRPVEFKHDHAVLTDKGEVKLCLDLSTCEEATMLWPFDHETAVTKKEDT
ncbi:uncharacterized protein LOC119440729 [Dermacentor silvarum]|uniref:uncharacterized protein LOC119440729 n=1 Tax=Dermacentor silvarum TaxID=543639 RepID=UPI001897A811|nr:uncharacterized protein LOC119440729 [Dermacentor silvarum]